MPKSSHDILYLSKMFSKCPQSVRQYLRYFSNQICCQELSKIAQSGHTASSLNVMALESQLFVPAPPRRQSVWTPPVNERRKTFFFKKKNIFETTTTYIKRIHFNGIELENCWSWFTLKLSWTQPIVCYCMLFLVRLISSLGGSICNYQPSTLGRIPTTPSMLFQFLY